MVYCISWSYKSNGDGYFHDFCFSLKEIFNYLNEINNCVNRPKIVKVNKINTKTKKVEEILCLDLDK